MTFSRVTTLAELTGTAYKSDIDSQVPHQEIDKPPLRTLDRHDYAVGWMCALPAEQAAAIAMLNERHENLLKEPRDANTYALGRMGKHNVVIACLPKGRCGTIAAATAAIWMLDSFPSIRFGLMVGVGAGIPSKVRLGDIVISSPVADYHGVVQWDMGKAETPGFRRTGALNNPPTVLLTALSMMESLHDLRGNKIRQYLDEAADRYPRFRSNCIPPKALKETQTIPNQPLSMHTHWHVMLLAFRSLLATCVTIFFSFLTLQQAASDKSQPVQNPNAICCTEESLTEQPQEPHVHCGLIASGNEVVKNAALRDLIDQSLGNNVLCIETEAAGLMNDFPCIVVRGIYDFADVHKAEGWQNYAAAVAAACANELLDLVDPGDVKQVVEEAKLSCKSVIREIASDTKSIAQKQEHQIQTEAQREQEAKWQKLSAWLSPLATSARHSENQRQRVKDTGSWLLEDPVFRAWLSPETSERALCCYGDPGAGKTIISSLVIDELKKHASEGSRIGVGYVYCDYRDQKTQTAVNVFGSVLRQLLRRPVDVSTAVWQSYDEHIEQYQALNLTEVQRLLETISPLNLHLFLTARPHIRSIVEKYLNKVPSISIEAHESDIVRLIDREIGGTEDAVPEAMDDELRAKVHQKICELAKGNFLLPVLQIREFLQNLTIREREDSLETLPSTIGEAYAGYLARIARQSRPLADRAARIMAWVHLAERPLSLGQLLCALSIKAGDTEFDHKRSPVANTLLNCCHGLVTVDQETSTVRLVHFSLQEHLRGQNNLFGLSTTTWHRDIAIICLTFAMFPDAKDSQETFSESPAWQLLRYAAQNWGHHLRQSGDISDHIYALIEKYHSIAWATNIPSFRMLLEEIGFQLDYDADLEVTAFSLSHVAAWFGLEKYLSRLAENGISLNTLDRLWQTPLMLAVQEGHTKAAQLLLKQSDTNVKSVEDMGRSLLHIAVNNDDVEMTDLLLFHPEICVNSLDHDKYTPIQRAALLGHDEVVRLLLTHKSVDVNARSCENDTPLALCLFELPSQDGNAVETAKLLLAHPGIEVNTRDDLKRTPLWLAVDGDVDEVIELLLEHGAVMDSDAQWSDEESYSESCAEEMQKYEADKRKGYDSSEDEKQNGIPSLRSRMRRGQRRWYRAHLEKEKRGNVPSGESQQPLPSTTSSIENDEYDGEDELDGDNEDGQTKKDCVSELEPEG